MAKRKRSNPPPKKRKFKKEISLKKRKFKKRKSLKKRNPYKKKFKKESSKKGFKRNPLKREFHKSLVSEHIIQIHAIKPSVFEFSPHKGIIVRVDGGDFKP
ncbi:hypothetical protein C2S29_01190 [Helicobacter pylori]|nr:hypothetical protein C2S29_01190 [Helicobacter pylori]